MPGLEILEGRREFDGVMFDCGRAVAVIVIQVRDREARINVGHSEGEIDQTSGIHIRAHALLTMAMFRQITSEAILSGQWAIHLTLLAGSGHIKLQ